MEPSADGDSKDKERGDASHMFALVVGNHLPDSQQTTTDPFDVIARPEDHSPHFKDPLFKPCTPWQV